MATWHGYQPQENPVLGTVQNPNPDSIPNNTLNTSPVAQTPAVQSPVSQPVAQSLPQNQPTAIPVPSPVAAPTFQQTPAAIPTLASQPAVMTTNKPSLPAFLPILIGVVVVVALGGVGVFFGFQKINQAKQEYKDHTAKQLVNFSLIQEEYDAIISIYNSASSGSSAAPASSNRVLGAIDETQLPEIDGNVFKKSPKQTQQVSQVLGLEDSEGMQLMRRLDEHFNTVASKIDDIEGKNNLVKQLDRNLLTKYLTPSAGSVVTSTVDFVDKTRQIMQYQDEMNQINIEATTVGYEWGMALAQTITNNADTASVDQLEKKTEKIADLKNQLSRVNVEGLSGDIKQEHTKAMEDLEDQLNSCQDMVDAIKQKDGAKLENAYRALLLQATSSSETDLSKKVSFWKNDPTITSVLDLKKQWTDFQSKL